MGEERKDRGQLKDPHRTSVLRSLGKRNQEKGKREASSLKVREGRKHTIGRGGGGKEEGKITLRSKNWEGPLNKILKRGNYEYLTGREKRKSGGGRNIQARKERRDQQEERAAARGI